MTHAQPPTAPAADETLRLDDALKLAGVAATGGEAKMLIQGGAVRVNGEVETRRKRRLSEGDVIEIGDDSFEIALSDAEEDEDEAPVAARDPDPIPVRAPGPANSRTRTTRTTKETRTTTRMTRPSSSAAGAAPPARATTRTTTPMTTRSGSTATSWRAGPRGSRSAWPTATSRR